MTTQYGEIINISLKLEDMQAIVNDKGYVGMSIMAKKETDQWGNTHYALENSYKPKEQQESEDYTF